MPKTVGIEHKRYDAELAEEYEHLREVIKRHIARDCPGVKFIDNPEPSNDIFDFLIIYPSGKRVKLEYEGKDDSFWQNGRVRYDSIHIPHRRLNSDAEIYVLINKSGTHFWTSKMMDIKNNHEIITKKARNNPGKLEKFLSVDHGIGCYVNLINGTCY